MKFSEFVSRLSGVLDASGRFRLSKAYATVHQSLLRFCPNGLPTLKAIYTPGFLHNYELWLYDSGCKRNTVSFYMTMLRSIHAVAVSTGKLRPNPQLFDGVFTGSDPTGKRALDSETIALLHAADLSAVPRLERCRDFFMLSFYLQGMPFIDLAHLRKSDIQGNRIIYHRQKTRGLVEVSIIEPAQAIIDKYAHEAAGSSYLLPLLSLSGVKGYTEYQSTLRRHNRQLKSLAEHLSVEENLSSYVARHSWATLAHHNGVDISIVSQAMGHQTEQITNVYLSSFGQSALTEANLIVLSAILRPIEEGRVVPFVSQGMKRKKRANKTVNGSHRLENMNCESEENRRKQNVESLEDDGGINKNVRHLIHDGR